MLIKPDPAHFVKADIRDLSSDALVRLQHRYYLLVGPLMAFVLPTLVCGLGWGDWLGGYFFAGALRLFLVHHSTFCVNSVAHYLGEQRFDDSRTARDSLLTALLTFGEGFHNFHHEFPADFRNGIEWFHYDPTKWLILALHAVGAASQLKRFPQNEIRRAVLYMKERRLAQLRAAIVPPRAPASLPLMSWPEYERRARGASQQLLLVDGLVHDVTAFAPTHPGGELLLRAYLGTDASELFHGRTQPLLYRHSRGAQNLLSNMRVARIDLDSVPQQQSQRHSQDNKKFD
jgi:stearoyl-CoA desaturase (delta-9 desaturase)